MSLETLMSNLGGLSGTDSEKEKVRSNSNGIREDEYYVAILERGFEYKFPFILNNKMRNIAQGICKNLPDNEAKSRRLFDWTVKNIKYGKQKRGREGYRNSIEVFETREGVCGEMATLYVTMARAVGIRSSYVNVIKDFKGTDVGHACAMIDIPGKFDRFSLVDPAYKSFDIAHKKFRPLSDFEIYETYKRWNP